MLTSDELNQLNDGFNKFLEDLKFLSTIDIRIYIGIFAAALTVIWGFGISKRRNNSRKARISRAKEAGHVIEAKQIDSRVQHNGKDPSNHTATYIYSVNGKEKRYIAKSDNFLPETISLYYDDTPNKVFSAYDGDFLGLFILLPYFIFVPLGTLWLVAALLGYRW